MNVFELFAKIGMDASEFEKGIKTSSNAFEAFAKTINTTAIQSTKAALELGTKVVSETTKAFAKATTETATYGDTVDKMSQKMGMSAEAYQEWDAVMQHSGTSMETLKAGMKTLTTAAETGNKAFETLGITQEQIAGMSQEELFSSTITALQNVESETQRTYLASQLLGRGATELGALLNTSAEDTEAMKQRVHELGGVMSSEAVKASAAFKDNMQDLTTAIGGFKKGIMTNFLPGVNSMLSGFTKLIAGEQGATDEISEGIENIVTQIDTALGEGGTIYQIIEKLPELLPVVVEGAVKLFTGLIEAFDTVVTLLEPKIPMLIDTIVDGLIRCLPLLVQGGFRLLVGIITGIAENADKLVNAVIELIPVVVDTIIDNLPLIIEAGAKILGAIVIGIAEHLPELVSKMLEVMGAILSEIWNHLGDLFDAGMDIIVEIGKGIAHSFEPIAEALVDMWDGITSFFSGIWEEAVNIGERIIEGICEGISNAIDGWVDFWEDVGGDMIDSVLSFFGIASPSKLFRDMVGKNLALGISEGFVDEMDSVTQTMQESLPTSLETSVNVGATATSGGSTANAGDRTIVLRLVDGWGRIIAEGTTAEVSLIQGEQVQLSERGIAT